VDWIWQEEGLKVPKRQRKRGRLWLNDGSCVRLRPTHRNHVWSYDFVTDRTHDGRPLRILTVIDEYNRECLALVVERRLQSDDVLCCLAALFVKHDVPEYIRSDNGSEFTARVVRQWLSRVGVQTVYIEPDSPWENGYNESFNGKFRNELLNGEIFYTLKEAQVLIERWWVEYKTVRPHSSLNYRPLGAIGMAPLKGIQMQKTNSGCGTSFGGRSPSLSRLLVVVTTILPGLGTAVLLHKTKEYLSYRF